MKTYLTKKKIGKIKLNGTVDITDPGYSKTSGFRMDKVKIKPGEYDCCAWIGETKEDGERVGIIGIYLDGAIPAQTSMKEIGSISVDAGLAGFFYDKPDYNDEEWGKFCRQTHRGLAWINKDGFFSSSGYGDGFYHVYAKRNQGRKITALEIRF